MTQKISLKKVIEQLEKKTGKKIKIEPYYSEKLRKWTVRAVEDK